MAVAVAVVTLTTAAVRLDAAVLALALLTVSVVTALLGVGVIATVLTQQKHSEKGLTVALKKIPVMNATLATTANASLLV